MTPANRFSFVPLPHDAATSSAGFGVATLAPREPVRAVARASLPQRFEVRCADVHALSCEETLRAERFTDVVALACQHGALLHGFTPAWYSRQRLALIARAVTNSVAEPGQPPSARDVEHYAAAREGGARR